MRIAESWVVAAAVIVGCGGTSSTPTSSNDEDASALDAGDDASALDAGDASSLDAGDASPSTCPASAPAEGSPCSGAADACLYDPTCPSGSGQIRKLSFSCVNQKWTDTLGPGPACEGPAPIDGGPSPSQGCTSTGGAIQTQQCCASAGDFPNTCGLGACSCAPSSSHAIQVCVCGSGNCFNGTKCIPGGG